MLQFRHQLSELLALLLALAVQYNETGLFGGEFLGRDEGKTRVRPVQKLVRHIQVVPLVLFVIEVEELVRVVVNVLRLGVLHELLLHSDRIRQNLTESQFHGILAPWYHDTVGCHSTLVP